jgi:hypothetical protein
LSEDNHIDFSQICSQSQKSQPFVVATQRIYQQLDAMNPQASVNDKITKTATIVHKDIFYRTYFISATVEVKGQFIL